MHGVLTRLKAKDGKTPEDVDNIVKNLKPGLTSSTNIGLADFYPSTSGKEKAAQYVVDKFGSRLEEAFLMCDDDNDMGELLHMCNRKLSACTVLCQLTQARAIPLQAAPGQDHWSNSWRDAWTHDLQGLKL